MQPPISIQSTDIVGMQIPQSLSPQENHWINANSDTQPRPLSLDDLPTEIIEEIIEYLLIQQHHLISFCACDESDLRLLGPPNATRRDYSGPTWVLSCISRRYRDIVFRGHMRRHLYLRNYGCCIDKVLTMPDHIRSSITYVSRNPDQLCCSP